MRGRPLCFICLCFSGVLFFLLTIWPMPVYNDTTFEDRLIRVLGEVDQKECKNSHYIIYLKNAYRSGSAIPQKTYQKQNQTEGILVYCDDSVKSFDDLPPIGSIVCLSGKQKLFERPRNEGQFDMARYYQIRGLDYMLMNGRVETVSRRYDVYREFLANLRQKLCTVYSRMLGEADASIICAMVLGDKTGMDGELKELYQRSGLSHLLCISGLHISLIGIALYKLLRKCFLPIPVASVISAIFIISYGTMTGMGTATKRAIIMFLVCILADVVGRTYDLLSALAFAAMLTLLQEPLLLYDSGFLLSFGALLGIGLVSPAIDKIIPGKNKIAKALKMSLSINLFTLPLTFFFFYQYPVYSILLNLVMIPLMTYLLLAGIFCGIIGSFCLELGTVLAVPCHLILFIYERGCSLCDRLPASIFVGGKPGTIQIAGYYFLLLLLIIFLGKKKQNMKCCLISYGLLVFMVVQLLYRPIPELQISMIDVGQGDCIFLRLRSGVTCLIDGGSTDIRQSGKYRIVPYLKSQGISKLDYIFISHTDADHMNGVLEMLSETKKGGIHIGTLILPDIPDDSNEHAALVEGADTNNIPIRYFKQGDSLEKDEFSLTCLYPKKDTIPESKNAGSMVLKMQFEGKNGLFTGDLEGQGEEVVTEELSKEKYLFLKVAHHGSGNSTKDDFLCKVRPEISLISCGVDNSYGHPHKELLERLESADSMVYITQNSGGITVACEGDEVKIRCFYQ